MTDHTERERSVSYQNEIKLLHICGSKCFSRLRPAGYAVPSLKRRFYEAALRAMKRSLFRLHSPFLPAAKMVGV